MDFLVIYLLVMTVPGALLLHLLRLDINRAGISIALSLSVLVLALVIARGTGIGTSGFGYLLIVVYAAIVVAVLMLRRTGLRPVPAGAWNGFADCTPLLVLGAVGGYMLWAGAYTEVPADAWWHIGRINDQMEKVAQGSVGSLSGIEDIFDKFAFYWYTLIAYFLELTGRRLDDSLGYIAAANTLLLCTGVYAFSFWIFETIVPSRSTRHAIAAAAVFFFVVHFGISVFSYVRYYVYAPTILNYVVYLSAVACVLRFLQEDRGDYRFLGVAALLTVVAAMLHLQEAVFIATMSGMVILIEFWRICRKRSLSGTSSGRDGQWMLEKRAPVMLAALATIYIVTHAFAYVMITRHDPLAHGVMSDIRKYLPFLNNLYVLKPTYQFYQVVTAWGVLVYILFLLNYKRFLGSSFLLAGMLVPAFTVFNPVFTDLFLRFSWPEVLWRMCYMIPLPLIGGYFLVTAVKGAWNRRTVGSTSIMLATVAALFGLLLPVKTTFFVSPYSKVYTLQPVQPGNDYRLWDDLLNFLDTQERARIITDRVTGYVINGLTRHKYGGYKFYDLAPFKVDRDTYRKRSFRYKTGWIVVINARDGNTSLVGRHGGHWPVDIMQVSKLYSDAFLEYVDEHPSLFERIWSKDRISVYRIRAV